MHALVLALLTAAPQWTPIAKDAKNAVSARTIKSEGDMRWVDVLLRVGAKTSVATNQFDCARDVFRTVEAKNLTPLTEWDPIAPNSAAFHVKTWACSN